MRQWWEQPDRTRICGQIALAVITGLSVEQAIRQVGHEHGTTTRVLARHLRAFGYECGDRCRRRARSEMPDLALAQLHSPNWRGWHWIVVDDGVVFDGRERRRRAVGLRAYEFDAWRFDGARITSYLAITPPA